MNERVGESDSALDSAPPPRPKDREHAYGVWDNSDSPVPAPTETYGVPGETAGSPHGIESIQSYDPEVHSEFRYAGPPAGPQEQESERVIWRRGDSPVEGDVPPGATSDQQRTEFPGNPQEQSVADTWADERGDAAPDKPTEPPPTVTDATTDDNGDRSTTDATEIDSGSGTQDVEAARDRVDQAYREEEARDGVNAALARPDTDGAELSTAEDSGARPDKAREESDFDAPQDEQVQFQPTRQDRATGPEGAPGINVPETAGASSAADNWTNGVPAGRSPDLPRELQERFASESLLADRHDTLTEGEFRAPYRDQFLEPMNRVSEQVAPFTAPEDLVDRINPDFETAEPYQNNCADCARSFERAWRGHVEEAAGRSYETGTQQHPGLFADGEPSDDMTEEWAGRAMESPTSPADLRTALEQAGPGSSAVVHSRWADDDGYRRGHAYNVVNDHGIIKTVDSQMHEVFEFDDTGIRSGIAADGAHSVLAWDSQGKVLHV